MARQEIHAEEVSQDTGETHQNITGTKVGTKFATDVNIIGDTSGSSSGTLATQLAEVGDDIYLGNADIGTATSAALWRIKKINCTPSLTTVSWADGDASFDNIWDDRLSLTYT